MRRVLVIVPAVMLSLLAAGTASADKPEREVTHVDDTFESEDCGFLVLVHERGTIITTTYTYKDASIREHESYPGLRWTLTNPDTGESIVVGIPGPGSLELNPDGSGSFTGTGPWTWFENPNTGEPGIFLTRGRFVFTFDDQGTVTSFSIVGTMEELCSQLAG